MARATSATSRGPCNGWSTTARRRACLSRVGVNGQRRGVSVVNVSTSYGGSYKSNFFPLNGGAGAQITSLIQLLAGMKIPVVIASGNNFDGTQGMGFPAIIADSLSV